MKRALFSILTVFALTFLAACGTSEDQAPDGQSRETAEEASNQNESQGEQEPQEPITLYIQNVFSGSPAPEEFLNTTGQLIQGAFPHIEQIEYHNNNTRTLEQVFINNDPIDIVITSQATFNSAFVENSLHIDLDELIRKHNYDLDTLDRSSLELVRVLGGGDLYGLPVDAGGTWLVYNKDIFDSFGVPYPSDHMNWSEFIELSRELSRTEGDVAYHGAALAPVNFIIRNPYGLSPIHPETLEPDFSDPNWSKFLNQIIALYEIPGNKKTSAQLGTSGALNLFQTEQTAAMYSPIVSNDLSLASNFEQMNFDFTHFPMMADAPGNIQTYPNIYAVASTSQYKDDAFHVIAYMTSKEVQLSKARTGSFPVNNDSEILQAFGEDTPDFIKNKNLSIFTEPNPYQAPEVMTPYDRTANLELNKAITNVLVGESDLNSALRTATETAKQFIDEMKAQE